MLVNKNQRVPYNLKKYSKINVLDCGCGEGDDSSFFLNHECHVTSVDKCFSSINKIIRKIKHEYINNFEFHCIDLESQEIPKNRKYDLIICSEVLEHIYNYKNLLLQLYTLLTDNGVLVITVPTRFSEKLFSLITRDWLRNSEHINIFSKKEMLYLLAKFNLLKTKGYYSEWFIYWLTLNVFSIKNKMGIPITKNSIQKYIVKLMNKFIIFYKYIKPVDLILNRIIPKSRIYYMKKIN